VAFSRHPLSAPLSPAWPIGSCPKVAIYRKAFSWSKSNMGGIMPKQVSVGIDVSSSNHAIAIMGPTGKFCDEFIISHNHRSFAEAINRIKAVALELKLPVTVAIEGFNGYAAPFDRYLIESGFKVVAVNNLRFSRYREMFGQPYKNDSYDARLLADFVYRQPVIDKRSGCQVVTLPPNVITVMKKITRYQTDLIRESTRCKLKLKKMLTGYFPELQQVYLKIFSANCLALLSQGWSPEEISRKRISALAKIKPSKGKRPLGKTRAMQIKILAASIHHFQETTIDARIVALYAQRILKLTDEINSIDKELATIVNQLPQGKQLLEIIGISPRLAARILGETSDIHRFPSKDKHSTYCGVVCLENSSGKRQGSKTTKQANHVLKDTFMRIAFTSIKYNPKSNAYYKKKRAEGLDHWTTNKRLAHQLCKLTYKTLINKTANLELVANF
jgi:transposase